MASYSQANRPMRVDTPLGTDALLLTGFSGRDYVSAPFHYRLDLMSEKDAIAPDDLLRKPVHVTLELHGGAQRIIHGRVCRFVQLEQADGLTFYQAEIVPWLWFLSLARDCRIFQEMTVLDIVEKVFKDAGFSDFEIQCNGSYAKRDFCVQYRESNLDFVSRLLEEEGIYYYFKHTTSSHMMVLADANSAVQDVQGATTINVSTMPSFYEDTVRTLRHENSVFIGTVTLNDYDDLQPSLSLVSSSAGQGVEEVYDYPGKFTTVHDGERYARLRLEVEEATRQIVRGEGPCRSFQAGCSFTLAGHYRGDFNARYMLLHVKQTASGGDYRAWDASPLEYQCEFMAIPYDTVYRPPRRTPRPVVRGSQTALVVGKSGEEIWVDKYGRVKVQFYWDRVGEKNENSSCWVRVSATWAGKGWGFIQIPRMGQEVIVDFLEGDPDRPIITGRVYNAEQVVPYELPTHQTESGVKTRSSKQGGTDNFNEIRFEDKKGEEVLTIHAEKDEIHGVENDRTREVGHDETTTVHHDRTETVDNDETISIGNDRTEDVGNNETITIGNDRKEEVGNNETISIGADRKEDVGGDETISIGGKRTEEVGGNEAIKVSGKRALEVSGNSSLKVGGNREAKVSANDTLTVSGSITIKANAKITLKVGGSSIEISPAGITLKGTIIQLNASSVAKLKGGTMMLIQGGAVTQVKGSGIGQVQASGPLMLKGAVTMIN